MAPGLIEFGSSSARLGPFLLSSFNLLAAWALLETEQWRPSAQLAINVVGEHFY
jgi:hypothetical protein